MDAVESEQATLAAAVLVRAEEAGVEIGDRRRAARRAPSRCDRRPPGRPRSAGRRASRAARTGRARTSRVPRARACRTASVIVVLYWSIAESMARACWWVRWRCLLGAEVLLVDPRVGVVREVARPVAATSRRDGQGSRPWRSARSSRAARSPTRHGGPGSR